jgi:DNA mismatch repair protein MutS
MAQWFALKADHPDALLFFRMGDFYELFFADADAAAAALDIALTHRGEHGGQPIQMCGVPVHAADAYLARLIRRGFRVAVAEQMEPAKDRVGRGPIRREVVRLITPGTLTEDALLEAARPNLLLALAPQPNARLGAAWLDVSTGLFETADLPAAELPALLGRLDPAEILAPAEQPLGDWAGRRAPEPTLPPPLAARRRLAEAFAAASLDAFGGFTDAEAVAGCVAVDYVRATQAGRLPRLSRPVATGSAGTLALDAATRASLEILRALDGGSAHTLLAAVQRTTSAAGARLLAGWLAAPLTDIAAIGARQDAWSWMLANPPAARALRAALRQAPDMARALARLSVGRGGPRDLAALRDGLAAAGHAGAALADGLPTLLTHARAALRPDAALGALLARALAEPLPARPDEGGVIAPGFDGELDALRRLRDDSRQVLAGLQLDYAQRYGVASLKIRHHAQLGYVIEVPAAAVEGLRAYPELTLRQGMASGARFSCPELAELDRRIAEAAEQAQARERAILAHLSAAALAQAEALGACAEALALLDVVQSCAAVAEAGRWCRPAVTDDDAFCIEAGRHPVVEAALAGQTAFVPNGCDLSPDRRVMLLTGPNMAGKSTFLRQTALVVILAQAGLPVPAAAARIGVVDRLFSRVGAADDLARGRSTFMVEMTETAAILYQAGPRSLVVVDEIGRGTATLDGLAIAWAVLEALHSAIRCRTIFATHFHELVGLAGQLPRLTPHTMRVREWKGGVVFLHEVAAGAAGRSWGVHVARLAGVPAAVVRRAGALLVALERANALTNPAELPLFAAGGTAPPPDLDSADAAPDMYPAELVAALAAVDPDRLTPREALDALYRLRSLLPGVPRAEGSRSPEC